VGLEFRARRVSTLGEVSDGLRMRVMGTVPLLPSWASHGGAEVRGEQWRNVFTESIDSARTMLLRNTSVDSMRFVMVTSALGNEGKTTLACQLALSLARSGQKTLLIDGDLRQPNVHEVFDIAEAPGLCEVLRGEAELDLAVKPASTKGLSILPAGLTDPQVLKLLSSGEGTQLFEELKKRYDLIIIDSSPILPVADSLLLAQHVDGVILSIRRDVSRVGKISDACERLSMLGVPILGAVAIGLGDDLFAYRHSYAPQEHAEFDEHAAGASVS
jgi:capsular exopolysaccharide synthesis family protein